MQYSANILWENAAATAFTAKTFDRTHTITLGSSQQIAASSAPEFLGNAKLANPEELFIASLSSCFMLTFLYLAALKNIPIKKYQAEAVGVLGKNSEGKMSMTEVTLKPVILFDTTAPEPTVLSELIEKAHAQCFISTSVKTKITIAEPSLI